MTPVLNEYKTQSVWGSLSVGCADLLFLGQPHSQKGPLSSSSDFSWLPTGTTWEIR